MNSTPSVALVILNWNTAEYLQRFLPSLLTCEYPNKRIYVIDNNSEDQSVEMLRKTFPEVSVISLGANLGYAQGYNEGLKQIETDYYLLINSDLKATPGFVGPLVDLMESDRKIAACQPKLLSLEDPHIFEYAGAAGGWIDRSGLPFARGRIFTSIEADRGQYDNIEPIFWASGACMIIRRTAFEAIGGFYNYYYMHQEDIDWCWRAQNLGYTIYSCPRSTVYHLGGGTLSWQNHLKTFLTFRNNYIMLSRNLRFGNALLVVGFRLMADFAGCFYFLATRKAGISKAILKAIFAYLYWLTWVRSDSQVPKGWPVSKGIYRGTLLIPYFLKGRRSFDQIIGKK